MNFTSPPSHILDVVNLGTLPIRTNDNLYLEDEKTFGDLLCHKIGGHVKFFILLVSALAALSAFAADYNQDYASGLASPLDNRGYVCDAVNSSLHLEQMGIGDTESDARDNAIQACQWFGGSCRVTWCYRCDQPEAEGLCGQ
jgi:hypothetical protein